MALSCLSRAPVFRCSIACPTFCTDPLRSLLTLLSRRPHSTQHMFISTSPCLLFYVPSSVISLLSCLSQSRHPSSLLWNLLRLVFCLLIFPTEGVTEFSGTFLFSSCLTIHFMSSSRLQVSQDTSLLRSSSWSSLGIGEYWLRDGTCSVDWFHLMPVIGIHLEGELAQVDLVALTNTPVALL